MAGLAIALDLLSKNAVTMSKSLHSFSSLCAVPAATSAALSISFLPSYPWTSSRSTSREWFGQIAVCEDFANKDENPLDSRWLPVWEEHVTKLKTYHVDLKPLNSAFKPRALGATTLRACLVNFLPLLEAYIQPEEDDTEEDADRPSKLPVDPVVPLRSSGAHVLREVAVMTTRRVLERIVVHYVSPRFAWKLLKGSVISPIIRLTVDIPKSAARKAGRDISSWELFTCVCRTTLRGELLSEYGAGHALGVFSNWVVQLVLDVYRYIRLRYTSDRKTGSKIVVKRDTPNDLKRLLRKSAGNTLKGTASLVMASIGAGVGTVLIKPSTGTWIGCAAGDLAGPYLVGMWLDVWIFYGTFSPSDGDI